MISISSVISLMVLSLATYSYSAPIVAEIVNATVVSQVENVTDGYLVNNLTLVQGEPIKKPKPAKKEPVSLSSSSSSEEGKEKKKPHKKPHPKRPVVGVVPLPIGISENSSSIVASSTKTYPKRDADEEQLTNEMGERGVEDLTTESSTGFSPRSADEEQLTKEMGERGVEDLTTESSTGFSPRSADEEQLTNEMGERSADEEQLSNEMGERSLDDLTTESSTGFSPRSADEEQLGNEMGERSLDDLTTESSTGFSPRSVDEEQLGSEMGERSADEEQLSNEMGERAMSWKSARSPVRMMSRGMDESMFSSDTAESFNKRAVGPVQTVEINGTAAVLVPQNQLELTTEGAVSTTELAHDEQSSTWNYETTAQPVEDATRSSSVTGESSTKILTVIPGRISKTAVIVNPVVNKQVVQGQLSQGKS